MNAASAARTRSDGIGKAIFLITIDTEGDNLWSRPSLVTTRNAGFLPRFQLLCARYGFRPTYLTDYEMAISEEFREFAGSVLRQGAAEIGMHLHAWDSPPLIPLTADDTRHHSYLIEYPEAVIREKIHVLTCLLEDTFGVKMTSHRAGRWAFNSLYARMLVEQGYEVDCSVTPHVSWSTNIGDPSQSGGTDYTHFPELPYYMDLEDISKRGTSSLLEAPVTIMTSTPLAGKARTLLKKGSLPERAWNRLFPPVCWLRPSPGNLSSLLSILKRALAEKRDCVEFMLHSSEFMPGGSPNFPKERDVEQLYEDLEQLFEAASHSFRGEALTDYARQFSEVP